MAACDLTVKQWGWLVGGTDTDARTVTTKDVYIKRMLLTSNDSADTITVTDGAGGVLIDWKAPPECAQVFEIGAKIKGLIVNPSAADGYVSVFVE